MFQSIIIPFLTVGLAELGDKSQLSILLLSSGTKNHFRLFLGVMLAFLLVDGLAILFGSWIATFIPFSILKILSACIFIFFGALTLMTKNNEKVNVAGSNKKAFITGFSLIFFAEWGDKTQIASAVFAAQYNAIPVFIGVYAALFILTLAALYIGKVLSSRLNRKLIRKLAGALFLIFGISFLFTNL